MKSVTLFYTIDELKEKREQFVKNHQAEYDEALQLAMVAIVSQNTHGPRKISLTVSSVRTQRMSMHVAEYLGSQGFKITADEKNSKVIIRW